MLDACIGRMRRASCMPKKLMAVKGKPVNRLPNAKPARLGYITLQLMPRAWIR